MKETEQVIDALESVERYLRNQDLSPIGIQIKGKVLEALERLYKNFVLADVRISLPSEEEVANRISELPYTKHLDDGQYNDGVLTGFELGADWMRKMIKGNEA